MRTLLALLVFVALNGIARAAGPIALTDAWSRPAIDTGVVYVRVANTGATADLVDGARSPIARSLELHRSMNMNGMSSMKPVYGMPVPANGMLAFVPDADHIMLIGLRHDLKANEDFTVDLHLKRAGWITTTVHVRPMDAAAGAKPAGETLTTTDGSATAFPEMAHAHNTEGVSQSQIMLDAAVFVLGFLILGGILVYIGKRIFTEKS